MWKLSTNHSAAGVIARSSRMALAIARYASRSTRPLSSTRGNSRRPFSDSLMTCWAAARLSACCSRRSTPKSSARIGSSNGCGANSAAGWALGITGSEAKKFASLFHEEKSSIQDVLEDDHPRGARAGPADELLSEDGRLQVH